MTKRTKQEMALEASERASHFLATERLPVPDLNAFVATHREHRRLSFFRDLDCSAIALRRARRRTVIARRIVPLQLEHEPVVVMHGADADFEHRFLAPPQRRDRNAHLLFVIPRDVVWIVRNVRYARRTKVASPLHVKP